MRLLQLVDQLPGGAAGDTELLPEGVGHEILALIALPAALRRRAFAGEV